MFPFDQTRPAVAGPEERLSRRSAACRMVGAAVAIGASTGWTRGVDAGSDAALIVRNDRPLDLESPIEALDSWLTPNDLFFVRSHFGPPANLDGALETFRLEGMVDRPGAIGLEMLRGLEQVTIPAVLQCAGNGRGFHRPRVPGVPWEIGAVGHAEWTGVRLVDLLERAGVQKEARHVHLLGADGPPSPKTPPFFRSIPIERALDPNTLVATRMNGEPLPLLHGGPFRLVVPGWTGNHWINGCGGSMSPARRPPASFSRRRIDCPSTPYGRGRS